MNGYLYLDQLACLKFRLFHMLLETCTCMVMFQSFEFPVTWRSGWFPPNFRGMHWCGFLLVPPFLLTEFQASCYNSDKIDVIPIPATFVLFQLLKTCPSSVSLLIMGTMPLLKSPFCLLSSSEDQAEQRLAISWAIGGVNGSQKFGVCCHWKRSFPCWYPRAISSWESEKFVLKERVQARFQEILWILWTVCCQLLPRGPSYAKGWVVSALLFVLVETIIPPCNYLTCCLMEC